MNAVLLKGGKLDTERDTQREDNVKTQENAIYKPRNVRDYQKLESHGTGSPSQPSGGTNPAETLMPNCRPPEL